RLQFIRPLTMRYPTRGGPDKKTQVCLDSQPAVPVAQPCLVFLQPRAADPGAGFSLSPTRPTEKSRAPSVRSVRRGHSRVRDIPVLDGLLFAVPLLAKPPGLRLAIRRSR